MNMIVKRLTESWDRVSTMDDSTKMTFISCLSPSHYDELSRLRPDAEEVRGKMDEKK